MQAFTGGGQLANYSESDFSDLSSPQNKIQPFGAGDARKVTIGSGDMQNFFSTVGTAEAKVNDEGVWDAITLNEPLRYQVGAVTVNSTIDMTENFSFSWDLKIEPATWTYLCDGIAFSIHPIYRPGDTVVDLKGNSAQFTLPGVLGRHADGSPVTSSGDPDLGQNIRSLGYNGGNLGISDLMNAIAFKIDTFCNNDPVLYPIPSIIPGTFYGSTEHDLKVLYPDEEFVPGLNRNTYGAFMTTNSNGYESKGEYSAPLNGMDIASKSDPWGSVHGSSMIVTDNTWHRMSMSYTASTYTLKVTIGNPSTSGAVWTKVLSPSERAVIADRNNWSFSILGSTGDGAEGNSIRNVQGDFVSGDQIVTTRYVDENGNDLKPAVSKLITDWQITHPGSTTFIDTSSPETITKDGKIYRRAQVNGNFFSSGTQISKRLGAPNVTKSGSTLTVTTEFDNVTFINYVYRQELLSGSSAMTSDLSMSINGGSYKKTGSLHPGDKVIFKYNAKNNDVPGVWSKVTAVQSLGGLFKPDNLPAGVVQKYGLLYVPLNHGLNNDLRPGELGANTISMTYQGVEKINLTANDQGQIVVTNDPVVSGQPRTSKIVSKVSIYDQSNQLIDEAGNPVYGSYFYNSDNNKAPLENTDPTYKTGNYVPTTNSVNVNDLDWWKIDPTTKVLTIYPHELNGSVDTTSSYWPWISQASTVTKVKISSGVTARGSLEKLFSHLTSATAIEGLAELDTQNVTNMAFMFEDCHSLTSIDVSNFNTAKVTDMGAMFYNCKSLTKLNVTSFNTANVSSMSSMFYGMDNLTALDLSSFSSDKVSNMSMMFYGSKKLWKLTMGPGFKFKNAIGLTVPSEGDAISDPDNPTPVYYATSDNWREVGTGTAHAPKGNLKTYSQIIDESKTRSDIRTYVWDQVGEQTLRVGRTIDFGIHRGSKRNHDYVSSEQQMKLRDNRNARNGKRWRIEAKVSKLLTLVSDSSKKISGNPLHHHDLTSDILTNLTSVNQMIHNGSLGSTYLEEFSYPWKMEFKASPSTIPAAGQYKGEVTYTLINETP